MAGLRRMSRASLPPPAPTLLLRAPPCSRAAPWRPTKRTSPRSATRQHRRGAKRSKLALFAARSEATDTDKDSEYEPISGDRTNTDPCPTRALGEREGEQREQQSGHRQAASQDKQTDHTP